MPDEAKVTDNPVLQDVADIALTRPDLSPEEWLTVEKATPYYKALLKPEVRQSLEEEYSQKYQDFVVEEQGKIQERINAKFEEWKKLQEPLNKDELRTLISQEYEEIKVPINVEGDTKIFIIRELPKSVEKRLVKLVQTSVLPFLEESSLAKFKWDFDATTKDKINSLIELIPGFLDTLAEVCAVCLDPFAKDKIDGEWVSAHLSIARIQAIVLLQIEVNKYRDFLLSGYRLFLSLKNQRPI